MVIHIYMPAIAKYLERGKHRTPIDTRNKERSQDLRNFLLMSCVEAA